MGKGDKIGITFPMEGKWIRREHHSKYTTYTLPRGEIMYREEPTDKIPYAFIRGPLVYCLDMVWNKQLCNDDVNMEKDIRMDTNSEPKWIQKPDTEMLGTGLSDASLLYGTESGCIAYTVCQYRPMVPPGRGKAV